MRSAVLSFTVLTALAVTPAMAQTQQDYGAAPGDVGPGITTGNVPAPPSRQPRSYHATNLNSGDTRSIISPSLPAPSVGPNASATQYLQSAQDALAGNRTGTAQAALENAETYLLNRSVPQGMVNQPDQNPGVQRINGALQALAEGNRARSMDLIQQAIPYARQYEATAMQGGPGGGPGMQPGMNYGGGANPSGYANYQTGPGMQPGMQPGMPPPPPPPNMAGGPPGPGYGGQQPVR